MSKATPQESAKTAETISTKDAVTPVLEDQPQKDLPKATLPTVDSIINKLTPEIVKKASAFIPLEDILTLMKVQEMQIKHLQENALTLDQLKQVRDKMQTQTPQAIPQQRPAGTGNAQADQILQALPLLAKFMGDGGGTDPEIMQMYKENMRLTLENQRRKGDYVDGLMSAIISQVGSKAAAKVSAAVGV